MAFQYGDTSTNFRNELEYALAYPEDANLHALANRFTERVLATTDDSERANLISAIRRGSVITWVHVNLRGEYSFTPPSGKDGVFDFRRTGTHPCPALNATMRMKVVPAAKTSVHFYLLINWL